MRLYLENMGVDGFGRVCERMVKEFEIVVTFADGTKATEFDWTASSAGDAEWIAFDVATKKWECDSGRKPVSAECINTTTAAVWYQEVAPARDVQYRARKTGNRIVSETGPGNCRDQGSEFDLAGLVASSGYDLVGDAVVAG